MPNWNQNSVTFSSSNKADLDRIVRGYTTKGLFKEFVPLKEEESGITKWGTKWDVTGDIEEIVRTDESIELFFDTAWSPPIEFYIELEETTDIRVEAYYYEGGMGFCGYYTDHTDECVEYSSFDEIPDDIVEIFGIAECEEESV